MLGDPEKNKWCCFCKHWFDPARSAIKPRPSGRFFDVDPNVKCRCEKHHYQTRALSTCPKFEKKD